MKRPQQPFNHHGVVGTLNPNSNNYCIPSCCLTTTLVTIQLEHLI